MNESNEKETSKLMALEQLQERELLWWDYLGLLFGILCVAW